MSRVSAIVATYAAIACVDRDSVVREPKGCPEPAKLRSGELCDFEGFCSMDGPQSCCGLVSRGSGCSCEEGRLQCIADDTCLFTSCSPGCGPNQFSTSLGCTACDAVVDLIHERLVAVAAELDQCNSDEDCVIASATFPRCGTYCNLAVQSNNLARFTELAGSIGEIECSSHMGTGLCRPDGRCTPSAGASCVEGHCRPHGACDPMQYPPDVACDDSNGCTDDRCDQAWGCVHEPHSRECEATEACSVGGFCGAGFCAPSLARGFTRTYTFPRGWANAITARRDGAIFAGVSMPNSETGQLMHKLLRLDARGELLSERTLTAPDIITDLCALDDGLIVTGVDVESNERWNLFVARFDYDGEEVWSQMIPGGPYAQVPRLACSDERIAIVWHDGDMYTTGNARLMLTDPGKEAAKLIDLGPSSSYRHNIDADTFVRVAPGTGTAAFVVARSQPRGGSQMFDNEVVVSRIDADGAIINSFAFEGGEVLFARGLVALPSGDVVIWGLDEGDRFAQRMTESGTLLWRAAVGVEEMFVDGDTLVALGTDGTADLPTGPGWLARFDLNGAIKARLPMALGPPLLDAALLGGGFIGIADLDTDESSENAQIWVRRTDFALPEAECR